MVKISIQKGKKATKPKPKPRQKQKQKQTQKVVVNMGKGPQKPTHTPIYIPQSNPIMMKPQTDQSMMDLIKYLKEAEGRKIAIQEKEKNELEKEKKPITPEDNQVYFSTVDNKTVLTPLGLAEKLKFDKIIGNTPSTKYILPTNMKASSGPYNPMSFYDSLQRRADLLGENPNTGRISLSTSAPIGASQPVLRHHSTNTQLTDLLRSRIAPQPEPPGPQPEPPPPPPPQPQPEPEEAKEEITLEESKEDDDEFFDAPEEESQTTPEQQGAPLEIITNEPTQAQETIGIDSTTTPAIVRPINDVAPPTQLDDLIGEKTGAAQADEAIQLIGGLLSPTKAASGAAADDDGPGSGGGIPNTTKPPYTEDEIYKMTVEKLGQVITANNITDDMFQPLIYNDQKKRIYRANNLGKQLDKPELRKYVLTHYGFT